MAMIVAWIVKDLFSTTLIAILSFPSSFTLFFIVIMCFTCTFFILYSLQNIASSNERRIRMGTWYWDGFSEKDECNHLVLVWCCFSCSHRFILVFAIFYEFALFLFSFLFGEFNLAVFWFDFGYSLYASKRFLLLLSSFIQSCWISCWANKLSSIDRKCYAMINYFYASKPIDFL